MTRVQEGDQQAFALLVERHLPRAYAIAHRVVGQRADAEDVAQEAFTRVWTQARAWQPRRGSFAAWLGRILVNASLDHARRQTARRQVGDADSLLAELPDPAADLSTAHSLTRQAAAIDRAVQRLPEQQRMAVVLCYFEEHSNPQAAALMGLHVKALEGLLVRARKQLRGWLGQHREEA
ncbi:sigma-70 family RNA polymerase sigma factor [Pseudomonas sp. N040]|uniref:sigma-70 family RNA polymerase sigma factor n=1 Tax=Pseudomonas sp. N040 TaxID=2785325 RepID=UPI0018A2CA69|nr:sigma-70 family RNA polymerase sigma factor [Pseudomonas sp. N040]MBF7731076.1 sigma-70 family RNA polymerase sigma factor [Pseudomonas sp. N040]MBW7014719.1 sigma-70 family RNA polymerase sigma factor [Pseudomonas sp. N040]